MPWRSTLAFLVLVSMFMTPPLAPAVAQEPYVLASEDEIEIVVFRNPEISRIVIIRPDGVISLPLVGDVRAAGLTPEQLRQRLTQLFSTFVREPQVAVIVRTFHRVRVSVLGQVRRPGVVALAPGATILDALAAAEGLAPDAGLGEVRLLRGQAPPVLIDLERLLLRGDLSLNLPLLSGDSVVVPEDATARIYVLGQVERPGVLPVRGSLTALQALTLAGGPTRRAMLNRSSIIRRERTQPPTSTVSLNTVVVARESAAIRVIPVDLWKVVREGDVSRDVSLQRGDVLYVPENPVAIENVALLLGVTADLVIALR